MDYIAAVNSITSSSGTPLCLLKLKKRREIDAETEPNNTAANANKTPWGHRHPDGDLVQAELEVAAASKARYTGETRRWAC